MQDSNKDRRELLMMKQDPEKYEDNCFRAAKEKYAKPVTKADDFFYCFKWVLLLVGVAAVLVIFVVLQAKNVGTEDLRVVLVSCDHPFAEYEKPLKEILEKHCPDANSNGKADIGVQTVDLTTRGTGDEYDTAESEKLIGELQEATAQMLISDEEFYDYANSGSDDEGDFFVDLSGEFPEEVLFKGCGLRVGKLLKAPALPDNLIIYIRAELPGLNNTKQAEECRTRALEVIRAFNNGG